MSRHWPVKVDNNREWLVGSIISGLSGQVIIPLDQISGMSDAEIGATVRSLKYDALYAVGLEIADHWIANRGVRLDADDFEEEFDILCRLTGDGGTIDQAIMIAREAIAWHNKKRAQKNKGSSQSKVGYIYLIKCGPYFKIGRTNKVERRMVQLGVQMPHPLEVVWTKQVSDMHRAERYLHDMFAHKRMNGEWFDLTAADIEAILMEYKD